MTVVGPITSTTVPLVYDGDSAGFGGPADMNGPVIGSVSYHQDAADDLHLSVNLEFGQPNSVYQVFLVCGPAHALGCGFRVVGSVGTNPAGQGSATFLVPFPVLQTPPFGPGYRTDHLDLLEAVGDLRKGILTAGALNYFVCRQRVGEPRRELAEEEARSETGDPLGAPPAEADPLTRAQR